MDPEGQCADSSNANFVAVPTDICHFTSDEQCVCVSGQCELMCMDFAVVNASEIVENVLVDSNGFIEVRNVTSTGTDRSHRCFERFTNGHVMGNHLVTGDQLIPDEGIIM